LSFYSRPFKSWDNLQLKSWLNQSKRIFTLLALGFIGYFAWQSQATLLVILANAEFSYLILSIIIWIIFHFILPICTFIIITACGSSMTYGTALKTHLDYLPARYLPGGIWHTVGRMTAFYTQGIKHPYLTGLVLLENLLALGISAMLGGYCVGYFKSGGDHGSLLAILVAVGATIGLGCIPFFINRWILHPVTHLSYRSYLRCLGIFTIAWFFPTMAFICYLSAFPTVIATISTLEVAGIYLFSWAVGFVAIFAPQGIGIFELVASHTLTAPVSLGSIAVLIAGFRIIMLIADAMTWVISRLIIQIMTRPMT